MAVITVHHGDNLEVLGRFRSGTFDFIYIDPPFNTGKAQSRTRLKTARDDNGSRTGFAGRRYSSVRVGSSSFGDKFDDYLAFLEPRLREGHRLLSAHGGMMVHLDYREVHYVKIVL